MAHLDLFIADDHEMRALARADDLSTALRRLRAHHAGDVVIKRGAEDSLWLPAGEATPQTQRPKRVRAVNTVGAGDSFNGALLASLVGGATLSKALRHAHRVAAGVVASPRGALGARASR